MGWKWRECKKGRIFGFSRPVGKERGKEKEGVAA